MNSSSSQIQLIMKDFNSSSIKGKYEKKNSDNALFSTVDDFSDIPDEDEGLSSSSQSKLVITFCQSFYFSIISKLTNFL